MRFLTFTFHLPVVHDHDPILFVQVIEVLKLSYFYWHTIVLKMTTISNISDVLGDYMLKGWVRACQLDVAVYSSLFTRSSQISLVPLQDVLSLLCGLQRVELPLLLFVQVAVRNHTYYYSNHLWLT